MNKKTLGIICAMEEELAPLLERIDVQEERHKAGMTFFSGAYGAVDVVMVVSGIGKVNAALCTQILCDDYAITHAVNVGVAGGVKESIVPLDVVVATALVQHDMDVTGFGMKRGEIPRMAVSSFTPDPLLFQTAYDFSKSQEGYTTHPGIIVTGDTFVSSREKVLDLLHTFDAAACEMEGAAVAQVCHLNGVPFAVIRSISDNANTGAGMDYEKFKDQAVGNTVEILMSLLRKMETLAEG